MNARRGTTGANTYTVSGKTLADINSDIQRKGPPDPNDGKKYAGSCRGTLAIGLKDADVAYDVDKDKSPVEATATVKNGTLSSSAVITTPKLASEKDLSPDALKEWKRFVAAVRDHEDGHDDSIFKLAGTISTEINALSGAGKGKDEKEAKKAALKDLYKSITDTYGGTKLKDRVDDDIKAWDTKTGHGRTQGAVLDTSIQ